METLKSLLDYFPMAVYTGNCLVFISENWRIELTEHQDNDYSKGEGTPAIIRVRFFKIALNGDVIPGHYEDFQIPILGELAEQIEKYIQMAVGVNLKEII
ncbi:MAG: hypothetical protein JXA96_01380 [Sedimentisphaerales bacterium]|nr:hypothetical protein [Sedimentisphaerales bacterium]